MNEITKYLAREIMDMTLAESANYLREMDKFIFRSHEHLEMIHRLRSKRLWKWYHNPCTKVYWEDLTLQVEVVYHKQFLEKEEQIDYLWEWYEHAGNRYVSDMDELNAQYMDEQFWNRRAAEEFINNGIHIPFTSYWDTVHWAAEVKRLKSIHDAVEADLREEAISKIMPEECHDEICDELQYIEEMEAEAVAERAYYSYCRQMGWE